MSTFVKYYELMAYDSYQTTIQFNSIHGHSNIVTMLTIIINKSRQRSQEQQQLPRFQVAQLRNMNP